MPVKPCEEDGKKGFKWGDSGFCYTYNDNDEESKKRAYDKAIKQGRAIQSNKGYDDVYVPSVVIPHKFELTIPQLLTYSDMLRDELKKWVSNECIPEEVYKELSEKGELPKILYINQIYGESVLQMEISNLTKDEKETIEDGDISCLEDKEYSLVIRADFGEEVEPIQIHLGSSLFDLKFVSKFTGEIKAEKTTKKLCLADLGLLSDYINLEESFFLEDGDNYTYYSLIWNGTIKTGVSREDLHEYFFYGGGIINGRYTLMYDLDVNEGSESETCRWFFKKGNDNPLDPIKNLDSGIHIFNEDIYNDESMSDSTSSKERYIRKYI